MVDWFQASRLIDQNMLQNDLRFDFPVAHLSFINFKYC